MRGMLITVLPTVVTAQSSLAMGATEDVKMNIMEQEIFDAIHSLILLKEEKDIAFFLENRIQQIDEFERSEFNPSCYEVTFKNIQQPLYRMNYALHDNRELMHASLDFRDISFGKIMKVFPGNYLGRVDDMYSLAVVREIPQGILEFSINTPRGSLTADEYAELQNKGTLPMEKLLNLLADSGGIGYGKVLEEE